MESNGNKKTRRQEFGEWLKAKRESVKLTQADLAKHLNYDNPQIISNIERGVSALPSRRVSDFAQALKCPNWEIEFRLLGSSAKNDETARASLLALKYLPVIEALENGTSKESLCEVIEQVRTNNH